MRLAPFLSYSAPKVDHTKTQTLYLRGCLEDLAKAARSKDMDAIESALKSAEHVLDILNRVETARV